MSTGNDKPEQPGSGKKPENQAPESGAAKSGFRSLLDFKTPKIEFGSRAYAGVAAVAGAGFVASRYVAPLRPFATILKGTAFLAMGAADAQRMLEREEANANHQLRAKELLNSVDERGVRGKSIPELSQRDYILLSFLPDNQLENFAFPIQAEALKVQVMLDLDAAYSRGLSCPEKMEAVKKGGHLYSVDGIELLRAERARIRDLLDGRKDGVFDQRAAEAAQREKEMNGLMRLASLEVFRMIVKRAGRFGGYVAEAFNMAEGAQLLKDSAFMIARGREKCFDTADGYLEHLERRIEAVREMEGRRKNPVSGFLPFFRK